MDDQVVDYNPLFIIFAIFIKWIMEMENTKHHHTVCSTSLGLKFGLKFGTLQRIRQSPVVVIVLSVTKVSGRQSVIIVSRREAS